jgi:hypothetical protein
MSPIVLRRLKTPYKGYGDNSITSMVVMPGGRWLLATAMSGIVNLWDLELDQGTLTSTQTSLQIHKSLGEDNLRSTHLAQFSADGLSTMSVQMGMFSWDR